MPTKSKNAITCSKCHKYQERKEFIHSQGRICNTCFIPYQKVIALEPGDPVTYVSKKKDDQIREEVIVVKKAEKRGHHWYMEISPKNKPEGSSLVLLSYLESIK